jgi:hypothetical protein
MTEKEQLEVSEKNLAEAQAAHEGITQRIGEAQRQVEELSQKIKSSDPDGDELVSLADSRSIARARVEVLEEREREASAAVTAAEAALRPLRIAAARNELDQRDEQIRAESDAVLDRVEAFGAELKEKLAAHAAAIGAANQAEIGLRRLDGSFDRVGAPTGWRTSRIGHVGADVEGLHQIVAARREERARAAQEARNAAVRRAREEEETRKLLEQKALEAQQAANRKANAGSIKPGAARSSDSGLVSDT